jgi:predicted P-loop ATPase
MSRQVDRIRPPYGRRVINAPRECIFIGTVNKDTYLKDETGGRRFWPVRCGVIRIDELRRDRDQLWAEAHQRFLAGEKWWMSDPALMHVAAKEVAARYEGDPWDELIWPWIRNPQQRLDPAGHPVAEMISEPEFVTVSDILIHCIGKLPGAWTQVDQTRVARSLIAHGWKRKQRRLGTDREWGYEATVTSVTT